MSLLAAISNWLQRVVFDGIPRVCYTGDVGVTWVTHRRFHPMWVAVWCAGPFPPPPPLAESQRSACSKATTHNSTHAHIQMKWDIPPSLRDSNDYAQWSSAVTATLPLNNFISDSELSFNLPRFPSFLPLVAHDPERNIYRILYTHKCSQQSYII